MTEIRELQQRIGAVNEKNGFNEALSIPEEFRYLYWANKLFLTVSELTEGLDELRAGHSLTHQYTSGAEGKPEGAPSEIADAIIRLLGICYEADLDIAGVIESKLEFNASRPFKHGGKKF